MTNEYEATQARNIRGIIASAIGASFFLGLLLGLLS